MVRPATMDAYLRALDPGQRAAIDEMRRHAAARLPGFRESFEFGMPYYRRDTGTGVGFAARGSGVAVYVGDSVLSTLGSQLTGVDHGTGCVRFPRRDAIDWAVVDALFTAAAAAKP